jgi:two-component system, NtrC family, response regulator HydG
VKRILVVDDEKQMVRTLCDIMRVHGWEADGRFDGEAGVEAVRETAYDVVLMDIKMTGINGVEALRAMRALRPRLPVILMTAYASRELLEQAVVEGALEVLSKPVALTLLTEKLEGVLNTGVPILVVDDDREYLSTLGDILRKKGYNALEAASLDEALRVLEQKEPVAAVLDLRLNHVEPSEVVLAIRRLSPAVTLILYSGYPQLLDATTSELPPGLVHAALRKPFHPDQLLELLDDIARS